jgi:dienelactone hydrolase
MKAFIFLSLMSLLMAFPLAEASGVMLGGEEHMPQAVATTFTCDIGAARERSQSIKTLNNLEDILASPKSRVPFYMEATDVDDAKPYIYQAFKGKPFHIRPIYFQGLTFDGNCTLVFAWLSTPLKDDSSYLSATGADYSRDPVGGAVLLHGGGRTALRDWCDRWARNGYASISISLEGQTIDYDTSPDPDFKYERTPYPGPKRVGSYGDYMRPLHDQWMYHAVSSAMLANTLLRKQSLVNAHQVGVTGVSWGGVVTSTLLPLDHRYAFAIPAYGCGAQSGSTGSIGKQLRLHPSVDAYYLEVWDPTSRLHKVTTPTLWISSPHETHFPLETQAKTYSALNPSAPVSVVTIPAMGHSHGLVYRRPESYFFVKSILESAPSGKVTVHAEQIDQYTTPAQIDGGSIFTVVFKTTKTLVNAWLVFTETSLYIPTFERDWVEQTDIVQLLRLDCEDEGRGPCLWSVTVSLPSRVTSWFVNCEMENGLLVSSYYNQIEDLGQAEQHP